MVTHVLDAADEHDVGGSHRDFSGTRSCRCECTRAHAVDREAGHGRREPCEKRNVAPERETLVAHLGGRGEDDVVDALRRQLRAAPEKLPHRLDRHVVGARLREQAVRRRAAEGRPNAVDVDHIADFGHGETILPER